MWKTVLDKMLQRLIVVGRLRVNWPDGTATLYGPGNGPDAEVTLTDDTILKDLSQKPVLALGEGYMDGRLECPPDALYDLLALLVRNQQAGTMPKWFNAVQAVRGWTRGIEQRNNPARSQKNVHHHYDISDELYRLFLDRDMQYSCAYFARPDMTLEDAQAAKKAHIAQKLLLRPGMRVLDIGCGWGGMALTLARDYGVQVLGVTLSENQLATARRRGMDSTAFACRANWNGKGNSSGASREFRFIVTISTCWPNSACNSSPDGCSPPALASRPRPPST